jgi:hypothetical protein
MNRGEVLYTISWILGFGIGSVFLTYITKKSGFPQEEINKFLVWLGAAYIFAYVWSLVLFSYVFDNAFEKNKLGWAKRALWCHGLAVYSGVLLVKWFYKLPLLDLLFHTITFVSVPFAAGMFIVALFIEVLGIEVI